MPTLGDEARCLIGSFAALVKGSAASTKAEDGDRPPLRFLKRPDPRISFP
jgi:hypothetical protein